MVEDAVEAIGFGKFQWKLSVITGLAWASNCYQGKLHDHQSENLSGFKSCSHSLSTKSLQAGNGTIKKEIYLKF